MNASRSILRPRNNTRVCSECFVLTRAEGDRCPACGARAQRREAWERVLSILVVGWLVGALVFQLAH